MQIHPNPISAAQPPSQPAPMALERFGLRHLKGRAEIAQIMHLREAIDLTVHAASGAQFIEYEKKETSAGSWALSSSKAKS